MKAVTTVRFLGGKVVQVALPSLEDQLTLASRALRFSDGRAQIPGKGTVHPRSADSFGYAMPAYDPGVDDGEETLGVKWVTGRPGNASKGLAALNSLVILNDPDTLVPIAILDGGQLTAARTAAVTGVAIRSLLRQEAGQDVTAAILGCGVQGHAHLPVLGHVLPGVRVLVFDRHRDRADDLADAAVATPGIAAAAATDSARDAVRPSHLVITTASFGPRRQMMTTDWIPEASLIVSVDYDTYVSAEMAASPTMFLIDEPEGYRTVIADGRFAGFREPDGTIGDVLTGKLAAPSGRILACHLGFALTDILFARATLERAVAMGLGAELPT